MARGISLSVESYGTSYLTEPSPSGTMLTSRLQLRAHGPATLVEPVLARLLARDARNDDARLKRLLEHGAT